VKTYTGIVKQGIGGASIEMPRNGGMDDWERLTGLRLIPGTLNIELPEPFDLSLLDYLSFAEIGWDFDPASQAMISTVRSVCISVVSPSGADTRGGRVLDLAAPDPRRTRQHRPPADGTRTH
jgi:hypothetical protein